MGSTILVEFETFVEDLLPPLAAEEPQFPSKQSQEAQIKVLNLFNGESDKDSEPKKPKEIDIAKTIVGIINELELPRGYKAALACYRTGPTGPKKAKVDAALYPGDKVPSNSRPDWTHSRLFIEFKEGEAKYDPWDDKDEMWPESDSDTGADVRAQSIAYAHSTFLHQHRTALYSLFIIGREFRAARWDRSGVIVSKKVDYVKHTDSLLGILWRIAQLDDAQQGLDPTATLIVEHTHAFRLMDYLARSDPSDADHTEGAAMQSSTPDTMQPPPVEDDNSPPQGDDPDLSKVEECEDDPRVFKYVREMFKASLSSGWPRYKLRVGQENHVFLVGKPFFSSSSLFGRGTRGYVAVDTRTGRFVFLKDSWRPVYEGVDPEGTYLKMFSNNPSLIVPAYLCDGDVGEQTAYTAIYEGEPERRKIIEARRCRTAAQAKVAASADAVVNNKKRSRETGNESPQDIPPAADPAPSETEDTLGYHIHYRIVVKDVCLPFDNFRSTQELIHLIYQCIATHYWAYTTYNLLHRDISCGNVLILPRHVVIDGEETVEWRGVLADWELAKIVSKDGSDNKARERTGTWQFMSVASVASQWTQPVAVADELESFFHVMLFYGVRYLPHTLSGPDFIIEYFNKFQQGEFGHRFCSALKEAAMESKQIVYARDDLVFLKTTGQLGNPLNALLRSLLELFQARYQVIKYNEALEKSLKVQDTTRPVSSATRCETLEQPDWPQPWMVNCGPNPFILHPEAGPSRRLLKPPSLETVERAAQLDTHEAVLQLFGLMELLDEDKWDDTDVVGKDQLAGYEPRPTFCMVIDSEADSANRAQGTTGTERRARKRAKTGSSSSAFDAVVPADKFETDPAVVTTSSKEGQTWPCWRPLSCL